MQAAIEDTRAQFATMREIMERMNIMTGRNGEEWFEDPVEDKIQGIDQVTRDKIDKIDKLKNVICKSHGVYEYMLDLKVLFGELKVKLPKISKCLIWINLMESVILEVTLGCAREP